MGLSITSIAPHSPHFRRALQLARDNSKTLGFLPQGAFEEYAHAGSFLAALDRDAVVGYVVFRTSREHASLVHLCVSEQARGLGVAKALVERVVALTPDCLGLAANCRRDFPAHEMWPSLGFHARNEIPGRSKRNTTLVVWWRDYGHPSLFSMAGEEARLAALDNNVLYDLQDPSRDSHQESKALLADWLADALNLVVTDEVYREIDRSPDAVERRRRRNYATGFVLVQHDPDRRKVVEGEMRSLLGSASDSPNRESDARHVAKAVAADASFLVSRDDELLRLRDRIEERWGLRVIRPCDLVALSDEELRSASYSTSRLGGTHLQASRARDGDLADLMKTFQDFSAHERKTRIQGLLRQSLADPVSHELLVVREADSPIGLMSLDRSERGVLSVPLLRVRSHRLKPAICQHLVWRTLTTAAREERRLLRIVDTPIHDELVSALRACRFLPTPSGWVKFSPSPGSTRPQVIKALARVQLHPDESDALLRTSAVLGPDWNHLPAPLQAEIEKSLWPAKFVDSGIENFIVPVRPGWALHLFEQRLADETLLGADPFLVLSGENVYYRSATPKVLAAPSRILWYVSSSGRHSVAKAVAACSYVNEVRVDSAKRLYDRYKRLGVYSWVDILEIAKHDPDRPIMTFRFSHTELLDRPVPWSVLQEVLLTHNGARSQLQSPLKITSECFRRLYLAGVSDSQVA